MSQQVIHTWQLGREPVGKTLSVINGDFRLLPVAQYCRASGIPAPTLTGVFTELTPHQDAIPQTELVRAERD